MRGADNEFQQFVEQRVKAQAQVPAPPTTKKKGPEFNASAKAKANKDNMLLVGQKLEEKKQLISSKRVTKLNTKQA